MQVPQVRMTSQLGQISIQQTAGRQEISQPKADLSIEQPKADFSIRTTPSKLTIDQSQAWEEMNLMSILRRTEIFAQEGKSDAQEGTARRAEQGDELMRIENGGDPIVQQALINGHDQMKTIGLTYIPSPFAVKISYEPSEIQIDAQANKPIIEARKNDPIHNYERGSVVIDMQQYPSLDIDFTNLFPEHLR